MLILEISYLHALCYNIYVIFIVVIIRSLGPRFIVSHRASGFASTALAALPCAAALVRHVAYPAQHMDREISHAREAHWIGRIGAVLTC